MFCSDFIETKQTGAEKDTTISFSQAAISLEIRQTIGERIIKSMKREKQSLPLSVKIPVSRLLAPHVLPVDKLTLTDNAMISWWLAGITHRVFSQGSYATVEAPVTIKYDTKKSTIHVKFCMAVYTHAGNLLWPLQFNNKK